MAKYKGREHERPAPTPKRPKAWDMPIKPLCGDDVKDSTFAAVGRALTAWEDFEVWLARVYIELIGPPPLQDMPAFRAYGSLMAFRARKEMVEAAAEAFFYSNPNTDLKSDLGDLLEEAIKFSTRRNEIAHGMVGFHPDSYRKDVYPRKLGFVLLPSENATNKRELSPGGALMPVYPAPIYVYASAQINGITTHFQNLKRKTLRYFSRLEAFRRELSEKRESE